MVDEWDKLKARLKIVEEVHAALLSSLHSTTWFLRRCHPSAGT
jgi:hypothetical protein